MNPAGEDFHALAVLAEPQRARIYAHLIATSEPRTQQEISQALGIGRTLVAFHLDKLQRAGLVHPVRGDGPPVGRGRPPQRYAASDKELIATMPPRRYELVAEVLVRAAGEQLPGEPLQVAATRVARRHGVELAHTEGVGTQRRGRWGSLIHLLTRLGYEPREEGDTVVLANCPFQRLRAVDTDLMCSINVALSNGYLEGLSMRDGVTARLRPCPASCCVVLERRPVAVIAGP